MKLLTLNVHSWLEVHQIPKIYELAHFIVSESVDVVALQEVNQFRHSPLAGEPERFLGGNEQPIRQDNFALILNQFIAELTGHSYYWGWAEAHIGFDRYDEGVAVLAKMPVARIEMVNLAPSYSYTDVPRRVALAVQLGEEHQGVWVVSTHMSWWQREGVHYFEKEFRQLDAQIHQLACGAPVLLAGDFNSPAEVRGEGYDLMTSMGWIDTFTTAQKVTGEATVHKPIAGWDALVAAQQRIDFVFSSTDLKVAEHSVIFPDNDPTVAISDHSGLYLDINL